MLKRRYKTEYKLINLSWCINYKKVKKNREKERNMYINIKNRIKVIRLLVRM